jgi:hypothetical protein
VTEPNETEPHTLSDSIGEVLRSLRGGDGRATAGLFARWTDIVGASVAAHVRPLSLDGERLLVEVDEPGWATQLRFLQADVLERLHAVVGAHATALDVRVRKR